MNLPNYITLLRVILIPFFINFMIYGYYPEALLVFIVACITDALDGLLARLLKQQTELGAFLDPMADKLLILSAFITLALFGRLPFWLVLIVISRDAILTLGGIIIYFSTDTLRIKPSIIGKTTTVLQLLVVSLSLVSMSYQITFVYLPVLEAATAVVTIASGTQYFIRGLKLVG
jgi:cardiolipin synthase